jgi:hypothetical protein
MDALHMEEWSSTISLAKTQGNGYGLLARAGLYYKGNDSERR